MVNLSVNICGITLKNPVMTASGTFGYGEEYSEFVDLNKLGAIVVKGISLKPKEGNPTPRIYETPCGMLNAIGLQNVGVEEFISKKLPFLRQYDTPVIVNFFGDSIEEFVETANALNNADGVSALELNVSCPNKAAGWSNFGTDEVLMSKVIIAVRRVVTKPLIVKLSPNVSDIKRMSVISQECGADAISLINTITGMSIDIKKRRPVLANNTGGLSGPAIKPIAVRMVWEACQVVRIPVIGMGGIMTAQDAIEFFIVGARAVAIGTANFVNPRATLDVISGLESFLINEGIQDINSLIGTLKLHERTTCN
ncbi:MAG: dihydroorotate dehydrogenase [Thermodesulfovibrionales bacterium]|nr:dihydroorotate dehydrogenase [Thermodesulfovibrionales bacterium]